jgi:hypothetical protein
MLRSPSATSRRRRAWAGLMAVLATLFAARVAGQLVQRFLPQPELPPFQQWQGSSLPYSMLLASQVTILGAMACAIHGAWRGAMRATAARARVCAWLGASYMAAATARLAVGLFVPGSPAWFGAWISAGFHVILASFVLALCGYHATSQAQGGAAS